MVQHVSAADGALSRHTIDLGGSEVKSGPQLRCLGLAGTEPLIAGRLYRCDHGEKKREYRPALVLPLRTAYPQNATMPRHDLCTEPKA